MTSKEFVLWLQGFTQGVHEYNISPKQWDALKVKLSEVNDESSYNKHPPYVDGKGHPNPYYFSTSKPGFVVTTNPGYSSISYNPSTSTTNGYPSGSTISNTYNPPYTTGGEADYITKETHNED